MSALPDEALQALAHLPAPDFLARAIPRVGRVAMVSSFGADSAVLLHMVAQIDRALPVIFIDTLALFPETLAYQRDLAAHLGLTDIRRITPDRNALFTRDPDALLHLSDRESCCQLRKAEPLERALQGFDGWITGRKRFQADTRASLAPVEHEPGTGRIRLNPLAGWRAAEIAAYLDHHGLPRHPLVARGYPSIGCQPCTSPVRTGEDTRAGRWRGSDKTECGIHFIGGMPQSRRKDNAA
ncbi:phosphoadenylyl-sulfate reductase [Roseibaca sp. V10]|uniref:Adenosine 5'-phosphosulfate reductase n=1 Tax=Roseinatronobacter domitianus TaxID=2940293 RepID=A0ABT0M2F1_9RHOB|nr:phosphoadenylyl-sulfate reductase [Roseibaca domitiana]MCL1629039.1 phosphoadenylyl-sulfate reductase [Roseibaca domitiana]